MSKDEEDKRYSSISANDFADAVAEVVHRRGYREIVTFNEIVQYAHDARKANPEIAAFVISVKKNYDPQNENDKLVIIQGLLDAENKPVSLDGKEAESRIIHTRTIDKRFLDVLNGAETKIIQF